MNMKANRRLLKLVWTRIAIELPDNCYKRTSDLGCEGELVKEYPSTSKNRVWIGIGKEWIWKKTEEFGNWYEAKSLGIGVWRKFGKDNSIFRLLIWRRVNRVLEKRYEEEVKKIFEHNFIIS